MLFRSEPFVEEVEKFAAGKKIALFGSYDWGDGEWMRKWTERMQNAGAEIVGGEGLICNNEPQAEDEEKCKELGKKTGRAVSKQKDWMLDKGTET